MKQWNWKLVLGAWAAKFVIGVALTWLLDICYVLFLRGQVGKAFISLGYTFSPLRLVPLLTIGALVDMAAGYWLARRAPAYPLGHAWALVGCSIFFGLLLVNSITHYDYPAYFSIGRYLIIVFVILGGWIGARSRATAPEKISKGSGATGKPPIASPFGD